MPQVLDQHVLDVLRHYKDVGKMTRSRRRVVDLMILVLSVITASSFWMILTDVAPVATKWIGAIAGTTVTGLVIHKHTSKLSARTPWL